MSTATATQGDDLIILSDNINSTFWNDPIVSQDVWVTDNNSIISFDTTLTSPDSNVINDQLVSFDNLPSAEINTLDSLNTTANLDVNNSIISVDDKDDKWVQIIPETPLILDEKSIEPVVDKNEENINWVSNIFWSISINNEKSLFGEEEGITNINPEEDISETDDMNSILNWTISRLKKRQTWIASQKSDKTAKIIDLEKQIKDLRDQVTTLKKEIVFLDDENIKIELNVWNLESMKLWKQSKPANKPTRAHNTKKLTK